MQYVSIGGDTETCDGDANCFQLSLDGKEAHVFFTDANSIESNFLAVCDSLPRTRDRTYIIWFHNISFDLPVIFATRHQLFRDEKVEFESDGWRISGVYSSVCFLTLQKGEKRIELLGTDSYFKTSLAKLADNFCPNLPKLKPVRDIGQKFYTAKDKDFVAYAERDAVIVQTVGEKIVEMHNKYGIAVCVSAPHMASRIFRRRFLQKTIPLPQAPVLYAALHSYHGGKNNFPVEKGFYENVYCVDIKSAYPYAMSQFPSFSNPELYFRYEPKLPVKNVPSFGIYNISGYAEISPWPIVFDSAFKPVYGPFKGIWITGFELNRALDCDAVRLDSCHGYFYDAESDTNESPFRSYVEHFYQKKEELNIPKWERDFYKLLMNSLYGKFIESRNISSLLNIRYDIDTSEIEFSLELIAGRLFNPFIATLITGHTRAYIHALECDYRAIHTSTDGIMTQQKPRGLSSEVGGISVEQTGDVLLLRNKLYIIYTWNKDQAAKRKDGSPIKSRIRKGKWVAKFALHGFFSSVEVLEQMIIDDVREYEYTKVNKLRESLRRNLKVNRFEKQQRILNV